MRPMLCALFLSMLVPGAYAEDVWRWKDAAGTLHYSNDAHAVPADATVVTTSITLEVDRLPGAAEEPELRMADGEVFDVETPAPRAPRSRVASRGRRFLPGPPPIYDAERLRFDCYTAGILYYGGFAQPDDISPTLNCYPYRLGPEAWLNGARAELAMRASGVSPRAMHELYRADLEAYRARD